MDPGGLPASRAQAGQKKVIRAVFAVITPLMPILKNFTSSFRTTGDSGRDLAFISLDSAFQDKRGYYVGKEAGTPSKAATVEEIQGKLWDMCWKWADLKTEETILQS